MNYIGRFAPSPTGPLHFGSLVAALASFLDARNAGGLWLLRIEDLDPPRESSHAPREIMSQLSALGLTWDKDVLYQSSRLEAYEETLNRLHSHGFAYPCTCSRKSVPRVYPGTCRQRKIAGTEEYSIRLRVDAEAMEFTDRLFGLQRWSFGKEVGDFIIKRKDGLHAYQLAVVVDDNFQRVNNIVRGIDLLDSTPRQLALYKLLQLSPPDYLHIPIIVDQSGEKLSKQAHAKPIDTSSPQSLIREALIALGQETHKGVAGLGDLLERAIAAWQIERIPATAAQVAPADHL